MDRAGILTGDLIGSAKVAAETVDRAMDVLSGAANQIAIWAGTDTRFTRFRGDGWQIYLAEPSLILRAMLLLIARLRSEQPGLATRLSIAVGPVDRLGASGLAEAAGPAFTLSGRNLDKMLTYSSLAYAAPEQKDFWKPAVLDLAHWQAGRWTREQAEAVALALDHPRPADAALAEKLGITRQALQSRLKGSGIMAMSRALLAFEQDRIEGETKKHA